MQTFTDRTLTFIDQWELDQWRPQLAQANIDAYLSKYEQRAASFEAYVKELVW